MVIQRLRHTLTVKRGQTKLPQPNRIDVQFTLDSRLNVADASAELLERLDESVRLRMIADAARCLSAVLIPAVVASMAGASRTLPAPVIGFDDPEFQRIRLCATSCRALQNRPFSGYRRQ